MRTSWALTGLNNGTKYYVYLYAVNGAGNSPAATASATLPNGTPRNYRVTSVGDGRVSLAWTTPSSGAPTSGYLLNYAAAGGSWRSINLGARTSYTLTGLRNGTKYYVYLFAVSSGGKSPAATTGAVPRTVPGAPRYLDADDPSWPFTWLTWDAPSNGGSAITGYVIQRSTDGGAWVTVHNGPVTMSDYYDGSLMWRADGLALGHRYYFRVAARNAVGIGPYSATVGATAATVPGSVPGLRASSGYYSVYLSWNSPSNGGSSVRYYQVQVWNGYYWETLGTTYSQSATITGVYGCWTYRVAAVNDVGTGPYSTVYACGL